VSDYRIQNLWNIQKKFFSCWEQSFINNLFKKTFFCIPIFIFSFVLAASANQSIPEYSCCKISSQEMVLDGHLDEVFWQRAPKVQMNDMASGEPTNYANSVSMVYDEKNLYLGYRFENPVIWGKEKIRDKPFFQYSGEKSEMFVKLFLDPDGDGVDILELHINPLGTIFDGIQSIPNINFNGLTFFRQNGLFREDINIEGLKVAVDVDGTLNKDDDFDNAWTVEVEIPFESLKNFTTQKLPPANKKKWRFSVQSRYFTKQLPAHAHYLSFPEMGTVDSHNYDVYAYLNFSEKPPCSLQQKSVWVWSMPQKTKNDIETAVRAAKELGFNVIIWNVNKNWYDLIYYARKYGLKAYAPLVISGSYSQKMTPEESKLNMENKSDYQRGGEPLSGKRGDEILYCKSPEFLHPFVKEENKMRIQTLILHGYQGIALDFVGYRNYYASFTPLAKRLLAEHINPSISKKEAQDQFFEQALIDFYDDMVDYAKEYAASKARKIEISCHIYPTFLPNPLYGNKCNVDYCGQTVSWFFKPYWSYDKIEKYARFVVKQENRYHSKSIGAPFIGFDSMWQNGIHAKSPERIRSEIQIVKNAGARAIQFAELGYILHCPEVAKVIKEELAQ